MWNEAGGFTTAGRSKEQAEDYRYFPEPDLVPVAPSRAWVEQLRATLPEMPAVKRARLQAQWGLTDLVMRDINGNEGALDLIEATVAAGERGVGLEDLPIAPARVAEVQELVDAGTINDKLARTVLEGVLAGEGAPARIVEARGLAVVSDDGALSTAVDAAIEANPDVAERIRGGRVQAAGALIGAVMRQLGGKADARRVRELIIDKLS